MRTHFQVFLAVFFAFDRRLIIFFQAGRKLFQYYKDDIIQRYFELRETVYSVDNIKKQFGDFIFQIPEFVYECEAKRWEEIPSKNTSCYEQIVSFGMIRLDYLDKELNNLKNPIN